MVSFDGQWQWLQIVAAGFAILIALVIWFFLVPHPSMLGIDVEEMYDQDAVLEVASQNDQVHQDVIVRRSLGAPTEEIVEEIRGSKEYKELTRS